MHISSGTPVKPWLLCVCVCDVTQIELEHILHTWADFRLIVPHCYTPIHTREVDTHTTTMQAHTQPHRVPGGLTPTGLGASCRVVCVCVCVCAPCAARERV